VPSSPVESLSECRIQPGLRACIAGSRTGTVGVADFGNALARKEQAG
jgi:hypothetical protein